MKCRTLSENNNVIWFKKNGEAPTHFYIKLNNEASGKYYPLSDVVFNPINNTVTVTISGQTKTFRYQYDENSLINGQLFSIMSPYNIVLNHSFPNYNQTYQIKITSGPEFRFVLPNSATESEPDRAHQYHIEEYYFANNIIDASNAVLEKGVVVLRLGIPQNLLQFSPDFASNDEAGVYKISYSGSSTNWDDFVEDNEITNNTWGNMLEEVTTGASGFHDYSHIKLNISADTSYSKDFSFTFYINSPDASIDWGDGSPVETFDWYIHAGIFTLTTMPVDKNYTENTDAVRDSLVQRLSILKGELWYQINFGLPLVEKYKSKTIFDMVIIDIISSHPGVASIIEYTSNLNNHQYSFDCKIQTIFNEALEISNNYSV